MGNLFKSIKAKLFFWFFTSLISIAAYFYLAIHIFSLPFGNLIFLLLLLILALDGFYIIYKITRNLTQLSDKMKTISSKNLNARVENIDSDDEIGNLAKTFNGLLDRIQQSFKREQQFIGDVAHELKTPLATLQTSIEIALKKKRSSQEYKEVLKESLIDVSKLSSTLKNVLDLAWSEAEFTKNAMQKFNLSQTLEELREIAEKLGAYKNIQLDSSIDPGIEIYGDRGKISQVLLNLLDNAVKYTKPDGKISISLRAKGTAAEVEIKDTGLGIDPRDLEHIFDRFYRGSKTSKTFGSGLGLAIAQAIIKAHRGAIKVKSRVNQGTTFKIILPLN
ncbi:MAG: HAMP domain-containing histidine kinase [Candidatus Levybacteria bacterium]|nr:HAMP domain-containing histidine kinase [Candidatus Levybacteria bacterium]